MTVLEVRHVGTTAVVTMNRPEQRNALDMTMRDAFAEVIPALRDDKAVKAIVLTGAGGHFCAGGDVKAIAAGQGGERDIFEGRERIRKIHRWSDELIDMEKPVIAAVDGVAFGAGLSLALCADFILASKRATFCSVFSRIGFVPDVGALYLLPRWIGLARAKELVFSARVVKADEALDLGLLHSISDDDVVADAIALANRFAHAPTDAIGAAKSVMNRAFESDRHTVHAQEAMLQAMCRESAYHQEAVRRFIDKEPAKYQW